MGRKIRVRISNDGLNSYSTRVLTSGMDIGQYRRNPVLLYMHSRGQVIGLVKDIRSENDEITGELEFDEATELSVRCKKQFEFGSLRMVSVSIDVIETSRDPKYLLPGQLYETVTKSRLNEVSVVDIGANYDAIVLKREGKEITLGEGGCNPLARLYETKTKSRQMEQKDFALKLGLPETADEAAVNAAIASLNAAREENAQLKKDNERLEKENAALTLAAIGGLVEGAVTERRLSAGRKEEFIALGKEIGAERLKNVLAAMSPQAAKVSSLIKGNDAPQSRRWKDLTDQERLDLRRDGPEEYRRLYEEEYGIKCTL